MLFVIDFTNNNYIYLIIIAINLMVLLSSKLEFESLFLTSSILMDFSKSNMIIIAGLARVLEAIVSTYQFLLELRVTLYWFPVFNPYVFPFTGLSALTDPFMLAWENVFPNIFEIDLSLYAGFLFLEAVKQVCYQFQEIIFANIMQ